MFIKHISGGYNLRLPLGRRTNILTTVTIISEKRKHGKGVIEDRVLCGGGFLFFCLLCLFHEQSMSELFTNISVSDCPCCTAFPETLSDSQLPRKSGAE